MSDREIALTGHAWYALRSAYQTPSHRRSVNIIYPDGAGRPKMTQEACSTSKRPSVTAQNGLEENFMFRLIFRGKRFRPVRYIAEGFRRTQLMSERVHGALFSQYIL